MATHRLARALPCRRLTPGRLPLPGVLFALVLGMSGCAHEPPPVPALHVVQPGDTLYAIAWRHSLDWRDLARWNGLGEDARITVGQRLVLRPPAGRTAAAVPRRRPAATAPSRVPANPVLPPLVAGPAPAFAWPVPGPVLGEQAQPSGGFGLRLAVQPGEPVRAAAAGQVAYVGAGLRSYGQLVIVKHPEGWLTAYGYNRTPRVREGEAVQRGQVVAEAGEGPLPGGGSGPQLYFEVRRLGRAVDPRTLLPPR